MSSLLPSYFFYSRDLFLYLELFCGESFFFFTDFFLLCSEEYGLERELVFVWHYFFPPTSLLYCYPCDFQHATFTTVRLVLVVQFLFFFSFCILFLGVSLLESWPVSGHSSGSFGNFVCRIA